MPYVKMNAYVKMILLRYDISPFCYEMVMCLADPRHGNGLEHATPKFAPKFAYAYDSGIVDGVNHGYLLT